jgi:hypothetical protein
VLPDFNRQGGETGRLVPSTPWAQQRQDLDQRIRRPNMRADAFATATGRSGASPLLPVANRQHLASPRLTHFASQT